MPVWALGLMSGTSIDGVDAAIVRTDGERVFGFGPACTVPYDAGLRAEIRACLGKPEIGPDLVRRITERHVDAARLALSRHREPVSLIGMHGHTILHAPAARLTRQAGDGGMLAAATGIDVVCDFRGADVAAGGQGAPLAPLYHRALCGDLVRPVAVLNIGGIANVTWIGADDDPVAFDTGPGNGLLDDWISARTGDAFDRDGTVSAAGAVDREALAALLRHPYFRLAPPKSLDRLEFDIDDVGRLSLQDGAATLARFTCEAVGCAAAHFPSPPRRWLATGGGRRNPTLMKGLEAVLDAPVAPVEDAGWDGDALEAQAFAFLAVRSVRKLPLSVPTTTGAPRPLTGGRLCRA